MLTSSLVPRNSALLVIIGESSNGRTADSDSANQGSNPCSPAINQNTRPCGGCFGFGVDNKDENLGFDEESDQNETRASEAGSGSP